MFLHGKHVKAGYQLSKSQPSLQHLKAAVMSTSAEERILNIKAENVTACSLLLDQIAAAGADQRTLQL